MCCWQSPRWAGADSEVRSGAGLPLELSPTALSALHASPWSFPWEGTVLSPIYRRRERSTERSSVLFKILNTCTWWNGCFRSRLRNSKTVLSLFLHAASKWGSESPRPGAPATRPQHSGGRRPAYPGQSWVAFPFSTALPGDIFVHFLKAAMHDLALSEQWKI